MTAGQLAGLSAGQGTEGTEDPGLLLGEGPPQGVALGPLTGLGKLLVMSQEPH